MPKCVRSDLFGGMDPRAMVVGVSLTLVPWVNESSSAPLGRSSRTWTPVVRADPDKPDYVSRGGHKLAGALSAFGPRGLRVEGRRCLDAGASTGGFTDVLLRADGDDDEAEGIDDPAADADHTAG